MIDFLKKSDIEFYREMKTEMTEVEFRELCEGFPEAKILLDEPD